jgi:quinol monooxygenase YgiN
MTTLISRNRTVGTGSLQSRHKGKRAACVREEPGCQQFNIVFEKDNPNRVMLFEVYDSAEAYAAHQATPHFKKYGATTKDMVKSRKRTEMTALVLNGKGH